MLWVTCVHPITEYILNTYPHSRTALSILSLSVTFHTVKSQSDPLIETWAVSSGCALFVVCALSARVESCTPHIESSILHEMYAYIWVVESVCFGQLSHHDGVMYDFHVEVSPGWVFLCASLRGSHMCSSGTMSSLDWDLHHCTTRLMGLAANTWPLDESKPYSLDTETQSQIDFT